MERLQRVDGSGWKQVEALGSPTAEAGVIRARQRRQATSADRKGAAAITSAGDKPACTTKGDTLMCEAVKRDLWE